MTGTGLGRRREVLIRLSAALAARDDDGLRAGVEEASRVLAPGEAEETILQSYLFLGYPITLNAFSIWRELGRVAASQGAREDWDAWAERGREVCRTVYGGQYEGLRRNVRALHPDMERWMVVEGYGKVLGRPGLDLATRELCIAAMLVVLRTPRQLYSHLRGALNAGATSTDVEETLRLASAFVDDGGSGMAWEVWDRVRNRNMATDGSRSDSETTS